MSENEKILVAAAVFMLALLAFIFSNDFEKRSEKTVTVNEEYSVGVPKSWNYRIGANNELVISNYEGELAFQDRSSEEETARMTIRTVEKDGLTIEEYSENITESYEEEDFSVTSEMISSLSTLKINVPARNSTFHVVDSGDTFYVIFSTTFGKNSSSLRNTLNRIIFSFDLLK